MGLLENVFVGFNFFLFLAFCFVSDSERETVRVEEPKSTGGLKKQGLRSHPSLTLLAALCPLLWMLVPALPPGLLGCHLSTRSWKGRPLALLGTSSWGVTAVSRWP